MNIASITSIGPPPERHADRVVAEMMRQIVQEKNRLMTTILAAIAASSDGSPKAQRKMTERVQKAGALGAILEPGKRGRYRLFFFAWGGWNPQRDTFILPGDPMPDRPQLAACVHRLTSDGRRREGVQLDGRPALIVPHHALSRLAQRCGARTAADMLSAMQAFWAAALEVICDPEIPPAGRRVAVSMPAGSEAVVVFQRDEDWGALVATTVLHSATTSKGCVVKEAPALAEI